MECFKVEALSFSYPEAKEEALSSLSFSIAPGEFVTLMGESGCGKTTLLRLLKPGLSPKGEKEGNILFYGQPLSSLSPRSAAAEIGFVSQDPSSQLVTDTVWHELAFGLESLGCDTMEIRTRVAEMASFFGIQGWFHKKVHTLSGGQKQILNLASVLVMQPRVLLLDEPTSQLDPIAAREFLTLLHRISRELGTAVLLSEHRLSEALPLSDRVLALENGRILSYDTPRQTGKALRGHAIEAALPTAMQIGAALSPNQPCPVSILEGKQFLESLPACPDSTRIPPSAPVPKGTVIARMDRVWFRYEKTGADILQNTSFSVSKGECFAILGGNGTGKTTLLSLLCGALSPLRGTVWCGGRCAMLPQDPACLFSKSTVQEMLCDGDTARGLEMAQLCRLSHLLHRHPLDLSGGEQMRLAIAILLLSSPEILLLDEPTRGMDAGFKVVFADILHTLSKKGTAILMVSHDIEFCAKYAHRCALFFDGALVSEGAPRSFFTDKAFYTTAANRIARTLLPTAVLAEDILAAYGAAPSPVVIQAPPSPVSPETVSCPEPISRRKMRPRVFLGALLLCLCLVISLHHKDLLSGFAAEAYTFQGFSILAFALSLFCLFPRRAVSLPEKKIRKKNRSSRYAALFTLLAVPLTLVWGLYALFDRKYYFVCLLIILEILVPFLLSFEKRKPSAKEIVCISVLCALTAASRAAFSFLPQFKPVLALVLLCGVAFGGETGFLVGALSALLSNFLFGQGPWTAWQMFATGLVGFLGGIFHRGILRPSRLSLSLFGALATFFLYGIILNLSSLLLWYPEPTWALLCTTLAMGIVPDAIHALSTAFFLWFLSSPFLRALERFRKKHGVFSK